MPNWAMGTVYITGKKENVLVFSRRFITDDTYRTVQGIKFFARSFVHSLRLELEQFASASFEKTQAGEEATVEIPVDFAWSANSCLIDGYSLQFVDECISLQDACIMDQVDVDIRTTEPGMCFEEQISCDRKGDLTNKCYDLSPARCRHCGEIQSIGSFEDLDEVECYECGKIGFERAAGSDDT